MSNFKSLISVQSDAVFGDLISEVCRTHTYVQIEEATIDYLKKEGIGFLEAGWIALQDDTNFMLLRTADEARYHTQTLYPNAVFTDIVETIKYKKEKSLQVG